MAPVNNLSSLDDSVRLTLGAFLLRVGSSVAISTWKATYKARLLMKEFFFHIIREKFPEKGSGKKAKALCLRNILTHGEMHLSEMMSATEETTGHIFRCFWLSGAILAAVV